MRLFGNIEKIILATAAAAVSVAASAAADDERNLKFGYIQSISFFFLMPFFAAPQSPQYPEQQYGNDPYMQQKNPYEEAPFHQI